VTNKAT